MQTSQHLGLALSEDQDIFNHNTFLRENFEKIDIYLGEMALSVKDVRFGAKGDGVTNDTAAIKAAHQYAKDNGYKRVVAPSGIYIIDAFTGGGNPNSVRVFEGITFEGNGYDTVLKVNPLSISSNGSYRVLFYESHSVVRNMRMDGSKDLIDRTNLTSVNCYGIYGAADNLVNTEVRKIWVHDIIGVNQESFGVMTTNGNTQVRYIDIEGWNVEGTPVHISGDYLNNNLTHDVDVRNCRGYDSTWQGVSLYGAKNVRVTNPVTYGNTGNGVNVEWSTDVSIENPQSYANGLGGIGSYGKSDFRVFGGFVRFNATRAEAYNAEIVIRVGSWYTGSPAPRANAGKIEFHGTVVKPNGKPHLYMDTATDVNVGDVLPDTVLINVPDGENWVFKFKELTGGYREGGALPSMKFRNIQLLQNVNIGDLTALTKVGAGLTVASTTEAGSIFSPVLVTSANQFEQIETGLVLEAKKKYRVKFRSLAKDAGTWDWIVTDGTNKTYYMMVSSHTSIVGKWLETECVITVGSVNNKLVCQHRSTGSSSIVLDYVQITELAL